MELLKSRSSVVYSVLSVVTLILVSFLILDCTRLLENYPWSSEKDLAIRADWAASCECFCPSAVVCHAEN